MKIAICSEQNEPNSLASQRFGRAPWIGVYDDVSGQWEFVPNTQNLNAAQGAGIQTAQNILESLTDIVLTCNAGPKAMRVLQAAKVTVYQLANQQSLNDCIDLYKSGKLSVMDEANVEGHWI